MLWKIPVQLFYQQPACCWSVHWHFLLAYRFNNKYISRVQNPSVCNLNALMHCFSYLQGTDRFHQTLTDFALFLIVTRRWQTLFLILTRDWQMSPNTDRLCFASCAYQRRTNFALFLTLTRDLLPLGLSIYCPLQLVDLAFFSILEPQIQPAILQSCIREIKSVSFFLLEL